LVSKYESEVVLVIAPRYADDVAMGVVAAGMEPRIGRLSPAVLAAAPNDKVRIAVVDARGALEHGLAAARLLGPEIARRNGGLLLLLSRGDIADTALARDVGATNVLVSPFNVAAFGNALHVTVQNAERLASSADPAPRDGLTGLANGDRLQQWLGRTEPEGLPQVVLMIGVGRIGAINAAYGRLVADDALRAVADRLDQLVTRTMPPGGKPRLLARLAAAEFAVAIAANAEDAEVDLLARQIVSAFATPFDVSGREIHLTARIGIAGHEGGFGDSSDALIRRGSAALAMARAGEPGGISLFTPDSDSDGLLRRADLATDLHHAIENDDITVFFQPLLDLKSNLIAGVEALVRWNHHRFGLLDAETLLETAAHAEQAVRLGRHIRLRAMQSLMAWPPMMAGLRLSLNVTAQDLADPGFIDALLSAIAIAGLPCHRLTLEITEGALIENIGDVSARLEGLRRIGIRIVLDDFGTGFSSLAWLSRLPIDGIKLDRNFTRALGGNDREQIVVETVVTLARRLGLSVVAEGVEDGAQLAAARAAGCDLVQGFEIAVPLTSARLAEFIEEWDCGQGR
jgi:predicted signal transduction protein with EAL and GGDEF domain